MNLEQIQNKTADDVQQAGKFNDSVAVSAWLAARISGTVFKECGLYSNFPEWIPRKNKNPLNITSKEVVEIIGGIGTGLKMLSDSGDTETADALQKHLAQNLHGKELADWKKINYYDYFTTSDYKNRFSIPYFFDNFSKTAYKYFNEGNGDAFIRGFNTFFTPPLWTNEDKQILIEDILFHYGQHEQRGLSGFILSQRPSFEKASEKEIREYFSSVLGFMESMHFSPQYFVRNMGNIESLEAYRKDVPSLIKEMPILADILFDKSKNINSPEGKTGLFLNFFKLKQYGIFTRYVKESLKTGQINRSTMLKTVDKQLGLKIEEATGKVVNKDWFYGIAPDIPLAREYTSLKKGELKELASDFCDSIDLLKELIGKKNPWRETEDKDDVYRQRHYFSSFIEQVYGFYVYITAKYPGFENECVECLREIIKKVTSELYKNLPRWVSFSAIESVMLKSVSLAGSVSMNSHFPCSFIENVLAPVFGNSLVGKLSMDSDGTPATKKGSPFFHRQILNKSNSPEVLRLIFEVGTYFLKHENKELRMPNLLHSGGLYGFGLKDALKTMDFHLYREETGMARTGREFFSVLASLHGVIPVLSSIIFYSSLSTQNLSWFYPKSTDSNQESNWKKFNFSWDRIFTLNYGIKDIFVFLEKQVSIMSDEGSTAREKKIAGVCAYDSLFCLLGFINSGGEYIDDKGQKQTLAKEELKERFPVLFQYPAINTVHPLTGAPYIWTIDRLWGEEFRPIARELMNDRNGIACGNVYPTILGSSYGFMPRDLSAEKLSQQLPESVTDVLPFFSDTVVARCNSAGVSAWNNINHMLKRVGEVKTSSYFTLGDFLLHHTPNSKLRERINKDTNLWKDGVREYTLGVSGSVKIAKPPISPEVWLSQANSIEEPFAQCFSPAEMLLLAKREINEQETNPNQSNFIRENLNKPNRIMGLTSFFMENGLCPDEPDFWLPCLDKEIKKEIPFDITRESCLREHRPELFSKWSEKIRQSITSKDAEGFWNSLAGKTKEKADNNFHELFFFLFPPSFSGVTSICPNKLRGIDDGKFFTSGERSRDFTEKCLRKHGTNILSSIALPETAAFSPVADNENDSGAQYLWEDMANAGVLPDGEVLKKSIRDRPVFLELTEKIGQRLWTTENDDSGVIITRGITSTSFILTREWSDAAASPEILSWLEERLSEGGETEAEGKRATRNLCRTMLLTPEAAPFIEKLTGQIAQYPNTALLVVKEMWNLSEKTEEKRGESNNLMSSVFNDILKEATLFKDEETHLKNFLSEYEKGKNPVANALLELSIKMKEVERERTEAKSQGFSLDVF